MAIPSLSESEIVSSAVARRSLVALFDTEGGNVGVRSEGGRLHSCTLLPSLRASASPVASFLDFTFSHALLTYPQPALDPSIRFLAYEWLDEPGGLADSLTGLATAFACALLTRRALILRHPLLPLAFAPNLIDWSFSPDVPVEPARRIVVKRGVLVGPEGGGGGEGGGGVGGEGGSGGEEGGRRRGGIVQEGEVVVVDLRNQFVEPEEFFALLDRALNVRLSWNRGLLTYWLVQATARPASGGSSGHRVAVVGIHLRANDTFVWEGKEGFGEPKVLSDGERGVLMAWAHSYMACAEVRVVMGVRGFTG
ncbi:unnamed protein product, partial [Closterium sp. Naga37s-1]